MRGRARRVHLAKDWPFKCTLLSAGAFSRRGNDARAMKVPLWCNCPPPHVSNEFANCVRSVSGLSTHRFDQHVLEKEEQFPRQFGANRIGHVRLHRPRMHCERFDALARVQMLGEQCSGEFAQGVCPPAPCAVEHPFPLGGVLLDGEKVAT